MGLHTISKAWSDRMVREGGARMFSSPAGGGRGLAVLLKRAPFVLQGERGGDPSGMSASRLSNARKITSLIRLEIKEG